MDVISGLAAASQALGIARGLRTIEKGYDAATYKAQIADLINSLTDAKIALSDAKDTLAERDKEIARLKANFELKSGLVKGIGDYNFLANEDGRPVGYPVCPKCENVDGRIIQLKEHEASGKARCPACSDVYNPVVCYLASGGYATKQEREKAEWDAIIARSSSGTGYF